MSWIYYNIVWKARVYIPALWRGPYGGYHKTDRWLDFKIKTIGVLKNTLCRIEVIFILLSFCSLLLITIYGQIVVLKGVFELIKSAV